MRKPYKRDERKCESFLREARGVQNLGKTEWRSQFDLGVVVKAKENDLR